MVAIVIEYWSLQKVVIIMARARTKRKAPALVLRTTGGRVVQMGKKKFVICGPGLNSVRGYCRKTRTKKVTPKRKRRRRGGGYRRRIRREKRRAQTGKGLDGKRIKQLGKQIKKIWPTILPRLKSRFNM